MKSDHVHVPNDPASATRQRSLAAFRVQRWEQYRAVPACVNSAPQVGHSEETCLRRAALTSRWAWSDALRSSREQAREPHRRRFGLLMRAPHTGQGCQSTRDACGLARSAIVTDRDTALIFVPQARLHVRCSEWDGLYVVSQTSQGRGFLLPMRSHVRHGRSPLLHFGPRQTGQTYFASIVLPRNDETPHLGMRGSYSRGSAGSVFHQRKGLDVCRARPSRAPA